MGKIKMYSLLKIKIQDIIKSDYYLSIDDELKKKLQIKLPESLLFQQLNIVRGHDSKIINEFIFVEAKRNKDREEKLIKLLRDGFACNNKKYIRFGKSPSQGKDGITTFIQEEYYEELTKRSKLGLDIEKCVISKYESYRSLIFSSCHILKEDLPNIVIVDEYEKLIPNQKIRCAKEKEIEQVDQNSGESKRYKNRVIIEDTTDISISPFDGFGLHTKEITTMLRNTVSEKCESILFQIRMPFMKGVTIEFNFKDYLKNELQVDKITDVFGKVHNVDDIDCLWNTTMWKGYSYFKKEYGDDGWTKYIERVNEYGYKLGVSKYNHYKDELNLYSRMNFQYLQCLDLLNSKYVDKYKKHDFNYDILDESNHGKIINLAKYSTNLIENIMNGDKLYTLKFLGIHKTGNLDEITSNYEKAILINDTMLDDISVKKMLKRRIDKTINMMKYGKIYVKGYYHTVVGDIIGYLEFCANKTVKGCLKKEEFLAMTLPLGKVASMRSPLVDASEVNVVDLIENEFLNEWFSHFQDHDVVMINMYDLTMQQQGGMDMDGDTVLLTDNDIVIKSKINLPIVVDMEDKKGADPVTYDTENIIKYELNSRDNRIGEITNIATSILNHYTENPKWKKINEDNIAMLRLYQGKEIDFLKTGFRWHMTKNLSKYKDKLPHFLLYNYPNKMKRYKKIKEINKSLENEDKINTDSFNSPTPLNELCEYIYQWERKKLKMNNSVKNSQKLLTDNSLELNDKKIIRKISSIYTEFTEKLRECDDDSIDELYKEYGEKLNVLKNETQSLSADKFINYCIKTAYRSMGIDKSLCWYLFGDEMINNLKDNSPITKELKIVECNESDIDGKEFLGRYYKFAGVEVDVE